MKGFPRFPALTGTPGEHGFRYAAHTDRDQSIQYLIRHNIVKKTYIIDVFTAFSDKRIAVFHPFFYASAS
jgi:hypothetical protein